MSFGYGGDTDFFGNCGGKDGCFGAVLILVCSLALVGYGITKGVKALVKSNDKPKTEVASDNKITPINVLAWNNVKTR